MSSACSNHLVWVGFCCINLWVRGDIGSVCGILYISWQLNKVEVGFSFERSLRSQRQWLYSIKSWLNKTPEVLFLWVDDIGQLRSVSIFFSNIFKIKNEKWNRSSSIIQVTNGFFQCTFSLSKEIHYIFLEKSMMWPYFFEGSVWGESRTGINQCQSAETTYTSLSHSHSQKTPAFLLLFYQDAGSFMGK